MIDILNNSNVTLTLDYDKGVNNSERAKELGRPTRDIGYAQDFYRFPTYTITIEGAESVSDNILSRIIKSLTADGWHCEGGSCADNEGVSIEGGSCYRTWSDIVMSDRARSTKNEFVASYKQTINNIL